MRHILKLVISPGNIEKAKAILESSGFKVSDRTHQHGLAFFYIYNDKTFTIENKNRSKRSYRITDDDIMWESYLANDLAEIDNGLYENKIRYPRGMRVQLQKVYDKYEQSGSENQLHVWALRKLIKQELTPEQVQPQV